MSYEDWRIIGFYERVAPHARQVRALDEEKEAYYQMLDLPSVEAALRTYRVPEELWASYADTAAALFVADHA